MAFDTSWTYNDPAYCAHYIGTGWTTTRINYYNGQFVMIGYGGTQYGMYTSVNGVVWTFNTSFNALWGSIYAPADIAWNGSVYVVVGQGGRIATSPDLVTWTLRTGTMTTQNNLFRVIWNGTRFVTLGLNNSVPANQLATSPDGVTWTFNASYATAIGTASAKYGVDMVWTGTRFVVISFNAALCTTSTDGLVWTSTSTSWAAAFPTTYSLLNIVQHGSTLVAFGYLSANATLRVASSTDDGTTWTVVTSPFASISAAVRTGAVCSTHSGLLLVIPRTSYLTTDGGVTWTTMPLKGDGAVITVKMAGYSTTTGRTILAGYSTIAYSDAY